MPNATILTPAQIAYYAQNAGFTGQNLIIAVAIALAESSGNQNAYNPEGSYGLWQIYLNDHPEYAGVNLYDPQTNANAAFAIFSAAGGFSPWSTYNSGKYQAYLTPAASAPVVIPGGGTSNLYIPPALLTPGSTSPSGGFSWAGVALVMGAILGIGLALEEL
jgi:hypothetical protein